MIAFLDGRVESADACSVVLACGGIGLRLLCSKHTLARIAHGEEVRLFVVLQVRDNDIRLYGFFETAERDAFQLLLSVQGVGGKLALAVLSYFESAALARVIADGDKTSLQAVPGLGARTAQRLITELEGKTDSLPPAFDAHPRAQPSAEKREERLWHDLASALDSLGFERTEIARTLQTMRHEEQPKSLNEALRKALKQLRPSPRTERDEPQVSSA